MKEMLITAFDMACIAEQFELTIREASELINQVWENETNLIRDDYRFNKKKWCLDFHYWSHYLYDKVTLDNEFPVVQREAVSSGNYLDEFDYCNYFQDFDFFFISMRIEILYLGKRNYRRMKLRSLLSAYGYKRRTEKIVSYLKKCLDFYHIQIYLRNGVECNIEDISLDDMITFRTI